MWAESADTGGATAAAVERQRAMVYGSVGWLGEVVQVQGLVHQVSRRGIGVDGGEDGEGRGRCSKLCLDGSDGH
jgi:hypothetical protein